MMPRCCGPRLMLVAVVLFWAVVSRQGQAGGLGDCWQRWWSGEPSDAVAAETRTNSAAPRESNHTAPTVGWCDRCQHCFRDWSRRRVRVTYGLELPQGLSAEPIERPLVLFVHGLNSRPEDLQGLMREVARTGRLCAAFRYPNDQSLRDSAQLLSQELHRFRETHGSRPILVVAHSMGCLVVRAVVEDPALDPRNVHRLIMIAPPNQGSRLARYTVSLDVVEYLHSSDRRNEAGPIVGAFADGCAEASDDLRPESPFLQHLNRLARNPAVTYSLLCGSDGLLDREDALRARQWLTWTGQYCRWMKAAETQYDQHILSLDEVFDGLGDGCVAVTGARLPGVRDVYVGAFSHGELLRDSERPAVRDGRTWILARLDLP